MTVADIIHPENRLDEFDLSFKVFHELMAKKVNDILLVSTPYDAFIMEEEGRLAERIIHEYRGLNLSRPPHLTWDSPGQHPLALGVAGGVNPHLRHYRWLIREPLRLLD